MRTLTDLQFEALITSARESPNPCDFALVAMPGLLGLRIFEAAGADIADVQIAARHADPRTTMHYDRARMNLDRHPNYILAACMASAPDRPRVSQSQALRETPGLAE